MINVNTRKLLKMDVKNGKIFKIYKHWANTKMKSTYGGCKQRISYLCLASLKTKYQSFIKKAAKNN